MIQELSTGRIIRIILSCTYILAIRYFSLFTRYFLVMLYSQKKNYPHSSALKFIHSNFEWRFELTQVKYDSKNPNFWLDSSQVMDFLFESNPWLESSQKNLFWVMTWLESSRADMVWVKFSRVDSSELKYTNTKLVINQYFMVQISQKPVLYGATSQLLFGELLTSIWTF